MAFLLSFIQQVFYVSLVLTACWYSGGGKNKALFQPIEFLKIVGSHTAKRYNDNRKRIAMVIHSLVLGPTGMWCYGNAKPGVVVATHS